MYMFIILCLVNENPLLVFEILCVNAKEIYFFSRVQCSRVVRGQER